VGFKQKLVDVVKPGTQLHPKDILMMIEDEITSTSSYFDEETLSVLRRLSKQIPTSKYEGVVDRIEVYYHGNKEDMSSSLRELVDVSDKYLYDSNKAAGKPIITGQVNGDYRVGGTPLAPDKAEIKIYITISTGAGVGDKGIFASQMKSVFGEVMGHDMHTESGEKIDAVFGFRSIAARVVCSPVVMGTTISLLKVIGRKAVEIYRDKGTK
jgi:hypothetical protein